MARHVTQSEGGKMLKKDVLIHIKGIQITDGDRDSTELLTCGKLYRKSESYYLLYEESDPDSAALSRTMLKVEGDSRISLTRYGATHSNLTIEQGSRNIGIYDTLGGDFLLGVSAAKIDTDLGDQGGKLHFKYALDVNSSHISDHEIFIDVTLPDASSCV